jgi:endonuclease/exonuclease/phosphatase family metal-dependent hydrolase
VNIQWLVLLLCAGGLLSCAGPAGHSEVVPPTQEVSVAPDTFRIVTYNVLHGLQTGRFGVAAGESLEQNERRFQSQVMQLARIAPDIVFLQEVNPLPARAERYVQALKAAGLTYDEVHQVDACGMRMTENRALFTDLNNGLVILAKAPLRLRKLAGLKLSGDFGRCRTTAGFQLEELRYGLIGEIAIAGSGQKYLVATTHLHSGLEAGAPFLNMLSVLHDKETFRRYADLLWEIQQSRLRRIGELNRLTRTLSKLKRDGNYAGIMFGGDLNFEDGHPEYEEVRLLRFIDTSRIAVPSGRFYTADPDRNRLIPDPETAPLPSVLVNLIAGENPQVRTAVTGAYRTEMRRPRQIDYLIEDSFLPGYCMTQTLFGQDMDDLGLPASDHFGLLNVYRREPVPCNQPDTGFQTISTTRGPYAPSFVDGLDSGRTDAHARSKLHELSSD